MTRFVPLHAFADTPVVDLSMLSIVGEGFGGATTISSVAAVVSFLSHI